MELLFHPPTFLLNNPWISKKSQLNVMGKNKVHNLQWNWSHSEYINHWKNLNVQTQQLPLHTSQNMLQHDGNSLNSKFILVLWYSTQQSGLSLVPHSTCLHKFTPQNSTKLRHNTSQPLTVQAIFYGNSQITYGNTTYKMQAPVACTVTINQTQIYDVC